MRGRKRIAEEHDKAIEKCKITYLENSNQIRLKTPAKKSANNTVF